MTCPAQIEFANLGQGVPRSYAVERGTFNAYAHTGTKGSLFDCR